MDAGDIMERLKGDLLTCLAYMTTLFNQGMSREALTLGLPDKKSELTPENIATVIERASLESKEVKLPFSEIDNTLLPAILVLSHDEYCVLVDIGDVYATVYSSAGISKIKKESLFQQYKDQIILIRKKITSQKTSNSFKKIKLSELNWFWKVAKKTYKNYAEVLISSFFINLFVLASPLFVMNVYDRVVPNNAVATLWALAIGLFVIFIFDFSIKLLRSHFVDQSAYHIDTKLSSKIFAQILSIKTLKQPESIGMTMNTLQGFEIFRDFISSLTITVFIDFPFSLIFLIVIIYIGKSLVIVPIISIILSIAIGYYMQSPLSKITKKYHEIAGQKQKTLMESLTGIISIKMRNAQSATQKKWDDLASHAASLNVKQKFLSSLLTNMSVTFQILSASIVVIFGVYMIVNNQLTMGGLIACTILTGRCVAPVAQISALLSRFRQSLHSIKSVDEIMKLPTEIKKNKNDAYIWPDDVKNEFLLKNVSFKFPRGSENAINKVNISIKNGERIGIIGPVGSGKSTLLKLIIGLYEPEEGDIYFSGHNIKKINPKLLRMKIGYVSQEIILFEGTLRDNIALGDPNISDSKILNAIKLSGLDKLINLDKEGFFYHISERGENLSGGQKQAVCIAQAFLHDPPILIFDEATAHMDKQSEEEVKKSIDEIKEGKTIIIATHKISQLSLVDRIILLNKGDIIMDGPNQKVFESLSRGKK